MDKGRPKKIRYIQKMPPVVQFSPRGKPGRPDEVELALDEYEALKLSDYQGFSQSDGAKAMHISRPSFGRILREARKKLAEAIVVGKTIKIRLGDAQVGVTKKDAVAGGHLEVSSAVPGMGGNEGVALNTIDKKMIARLLKSKMPGRLGLGERPSDRDKR